MPRRWPGWVFRGGQDPDYRFSFANERTFLAWIRTALALVAGGVALDAVSLSGPDVLRRVLAAVLVLLGIVCAGASWVRWAWAERAMRHETELPSLGPGVVLVAVLAVVFVALLAVVL